MQLGLVVDPRLGRDWEAALDMAVAHGLTHVEPCGGGHVPKAYVDPVRLAADDAALDAFADSIHSRNLEIASLGCYGNPVHPDKERADAAHADLVAMCQVAAQLDVDRVTVISGVPSGGPSDNVPNWIIPSIYADLEESYRWQWEERLIPYWREACKIAADHGVTLCMEALGGFMVYNAQTLLRLREACGDVLKANVDPSHLFWMGIDPLVFIEELGPAVGYAHAKDVQLFPRKVARDGVIPACRYDAWTERTWIYRAIGFGHSQMFWNDFFASLRSVGYDGVVSIEIEESFMSMDEALAKSVETVRRAMPMEPMPTGNWFDAYEWQSTRVQ